MVTCYRRFHAGRWIVTFCCAHSQIYVLTPSTRTAFQAPQGTWPGLPAGHEFEETHR
jgi:hypothetical protein